MLRLAEPRAQLGERVLALRIDALRPPAALRRREQRSGADEHDVRERAQQPHHELVVLALVGDERIRPLERRDRDDPVERLDEVRVDARRLEAELAGVERAQLVRQLGAAAGPPAPRGARGSPAPVARAPRRGTRAAGRRPRRRARARRSSPCATLPPPRRASACRGARPRCARRRRAARRARRARPRSARRAAPAR